MKAFLLKALSESGEVSSMRLMILGMVILFAPTFVLVWAKVALMTNSIPDIPAGVLGLLGVLLGGKVAQKFFEEKP